MCSPDGARIAYVEGRVLRLASQRDGSGIKTILRLPTSQGFEDNALRWSPDGKRISYVVTFAKSASLDPPPLESDRELRIIDIKTHTENKVTAWTISFPEEDLRFVSMFWLSNRNDLLMAIDKRDGGIQQRSLLFRDSLANKRQTLIFDTGDGGAGLDWHQISRRSLPLGQGSREP